MLKYKQTTDMTAAETQWIEAGYEMFAHSGRAGLKIEALARTVGVSKSSFYHYFVDLDIFTGQLLRHHLKQSAIMADKEKKAETIDPDLIRVLVEHKTDLLFNRQLRIHQHIQAFSQALLQSNQIVGNEFIKLWSKDLKLDLGRAQLEGLFELALENFFLQINADNLHEQWLSDYFKRLKKIAQAFT